MTCPEGSAAPQGHSHVGSYLVKTDPAGQGLLGHIRHFLQATQPAPARISAHVPKPTFPSTPFREGESRGEGQRLWGQATDREMRKWKCGSSTFSEDPEVRREIPGGDSHSNLPFHSSPSILRGLARVEVAAADVTEHLLGVRTTVCASYG